MKSYFTALAITLISANAISATKTTSLPLDTATAKINWTAGKEIGSTHNGTLKLKSGEVSFEKDKLTGGTFVIDMKTIEVTDIPADDENYGKLKGHLNSPDFFDTAKNDTATLKITNVKQTRSNLAEITGNLTIKGITKPVNFTATVTQDKGISKATGKITVNRTKYGIKYGTKDLVGKLGADKIIKNNFDIDFEVATTPAASVK